MTATATNIREPRPPSIRALPVANVEIRPAQTSFECTRELWRGGNLWKPFEAPHGAEQQLYYFYGRPSFNSASGVGAQCYQTLDTLSPGLYGYHDIFSGDWTVYDALVAPNRKLENSIVSRTSEQFWPKVIACLAALGGKANETAQQGQAIGSPWTELQHAVRALSEEVDGDQLSQSVANALEFIEVLSRDGAPAPTIYADEEGDLVFVWERGAKAIFVTFSHDRILILVKDAGKIEINETYRYDPAALPDHLWRAIRPK